MALPCAGFPTLWDESGGSALDQRSAARAECRALISCTAKPYRIYLAQLDGGSAFCGASVECRVGCLGGRTKKRTKHVVFPARGMGLRCIRAQALSGALSRRDWFFRACSHG